MSCQCKHDAPQLPLQRQAEIGTLIVAAVGLLAFHHCIDVVHCLVHLVQRELSGKSQGKIIILLHKMPSPNSCAYHYLTRLAACGPLR